MVIALAIGMVVALAAIAVTAVRTATSESAPVPATSTPNRDGNSNQDPHNTATVDPNARSDTEAAVRYGWQLQDHDEFDGNTLGPAWKPYTGETTDGVGRHDPANLHVADGMLSIVSHGLSSGGLEWAPGPALRPVGGAGPHAEGRRLRRRAHPVARRRGLPQGGEVDFMEIPKPERNEYNFNLHFGADNSQNGTKVAGDFTQWHNYAVEWMPDHVAGFVDGQEVFRTTERQPDPAAPDAPDHAAGHRPVRRLDPAARRAPPRPRSSFQIDWVRIYRA